jgi:MFS transporter, NNP family, nitrate/nitrite transporter
VLGWLAIGQDRRAVDTRHCLCRHDRWDRRADANPSLLATTLLFMLCFAALGAGNGATFQLVPLRWPATTAVAGSMIGEIGALGGSILPNLLGQSKQRTGSYSTGFLIYAGIAMFVFLLMQSFARMWTKKWVRKGGRAIAIEPLTEGIAAD